MLGLIIYHVGIKKLNAWFYIIIGALLVLVGGILVSYGWHIMPKNISPANDSEPKIVVNRLIVYNHKSVDRIIFDSDKTVKKIKEDFGKRKDGNDIHSGAYSEAQKDHALKTYWKINDQYLSMKRSIKDITGSIDNFKSNRAFSKEYKMYCEELNRLTKIYKHLETPVREGAVGIAKSRYGNFKLEIPKDLTPP